MLSTRIATIIALIAIIIGVFWLEPNPDAGPCVNDLSINLTLSLDTDNAFTTSVDPCQVFSDTYSQARDCFLAAAKALQDPYHKSQLVAGGSNQNNETTVFLHRLVIYRDDYETYTMDIVVIPGNQPGLVFHSSGVHGVEGYAGLAVQVAFLLFSLGTHFYLGVNPGF